MLIYNEDLKVIKDEPYVYHEDDKDNVCTLHTKNSVEPSVEPSTDPTDPTEPTTPPEPTDEPSAALPPDEEPWYGRRKIFTA